MLRKLHKARANEESKSKKQNLLKNRQTHDYTRREKTTMDFYG